MIMLAHRIFTGEIFLTKFSEKFLVGAVDEKR